MPEKSLGLWTVYPLDNDKINVDYNVTKEVGSSFIQEVRLSPKQVPAVRGTHNIGAVRVQCNGRVMMLFLFVRVPDTAEKTEIPYRMVKTQNDTDNTRKSYKYLRDWQHNDAVVINPTETLYLRMPEANARWNVVKWQMEVHQEPIPAKVLGKLGELKDHVDERNPWFKKQTLFQMRNMVIIRPVIQQFARCADFLSIVARTMRTEKLYLGKIVFRNQGHEWNKRFVTAFGVMEAAYTIERSVGLYLSLADAIKPGDLVFDNPQNRTEMIVYKKDKVVIKLTPEYVNVSSVPDQTVEAPWFTSGFPNFMSYKGMRRDKGLNVFEFEVSEDGREGWDELKFVCNNHERIILARYAKQ